MFKKQTHSQLAVEQDPVEKFAGLRLDCDESSLLSYWDRSLWEALHEGCSGNEIRAIPRLHTKCLWCRQEGFVVPGCRHLQNPSGQNRARRIAKISAQLQKLLTVGQLHATAVPTPRPTLSLGVWRCPPCPRCQAQGNGGGEEAAMG